MRIAALCVLLLVAPFAMAQSKIPVWKNGPNEKWCGLGTYQDGLDLGFKNATQSLGETLVTVQVLPSFQKEYALVLERVGADIRLFRLTFQKQLWEQMGPPVHTKKTRQECLEVASSAKVEAQAVQARLADLVELRTAFGSIDLTTDTCPRRGKQCVYFEDGTDYVLQTQDGRSFRITETENQKGVRSENPALLAWIKGLRQLATESESR